MGLFGRDDAARGRAESERILRQSGERAAKAARAMAARAGYDVAGAELVAYEAPRSKRCLVVRPDRLDLYDEDPAGGEEPLHERLWRRDLVGIQIEGEKELLAPVTVAGREGSVRIEMPRTQAHLLARLLFEVPPDGEVSTGSTTEARRSDLDVLRELAAMRDEGLISADDYDAKKAEVLRRM